MVLKKKVTAAVLAGVLATAAVVPMGLTASAANAGDVKVQYVAGAIIPENPTSDYYVTIPANILFRDTTTAENMNVTLKPLDETAGFTDSALVVTVSAYSTNDYKLVNKTQPTVTGAYGLTYTGTNAATAGTALANTKKGLGENGKADVVTNGAKVGTLTPTAATLTGKAQMTQEPAATAQGVSVFSDTITYHVAETNNAMNPAQP